MKFVILIVSALLFSSQSFAQHDFGMWNNVAVELPINDKITTGLDLQLRLNNNLRSTDELFFSPYAQYDLHKYIRLDFAYRLTRFPSKSTYAHREMFDIIFRNIVDLFAEKSRLSLDLRFRSTFDYNRTEENNTYFRLKAKASYNLPKTKLEPELASELFYHLNDQLVYTAEDVEAVHRFNKYRVRCGLGYPLNKRSNIKIFYLYQRQIGNTETDHILGLKYSYQFKKLKK